MNLLVNEFLGAAARHEVDLAAALDLGDLLVERTPRRQTRAMREQMAKRNVALAVDTEVMKKARQPIVEAHLGVAREHHHGDGGGERLGQRGEIEDGLEPHRRSLGQHRTKAEGALVGDIGARAHHQRRTGNRALFDRLRKGSFDLMPSQAATPFFASSIQAFAWSS